jgi:FAD/FMN-containing dehydrogenase
LIVAGRRSSEQPRNSTEGIDMDRRQFLQSTTALPVLSAGWSGELLASAGTPDRPASRVRPGDARWPSRAEWEGLNKEVGGRLIELKSPLADCRAAPDGAACARFFKDLKNQFYINAEPALTQATGWLDAWASAPSAYAVAAAATADVVAAVHFARRHDLRLVVKGGGHSYQGTSNAPDSLLIWTRAMNDIALHDAFVPQGCAGAVAAQPAVTVGAGALWLHVYDAVTTRAGRYVQGGGCTTVGVAGLIQSGGFGSFSKNYGLAAAGLLEAEVVTADGEARTANARTNPELFWALKGGGGASFGVVTKLTLRTRELPKNFGVAVGTLKAGSADAYRRLIARIVGFYRDHLFNPHWGEQIRFKAGNSVEFQLLFQGLDHKQAEEAWRPFREWVAASPQDYTFTTPFMVVAVPARLMWDPRFFGAFAPQAIVRDNRPGAPAGNFVWAGDHAQAGQFLHGYRSVWMPASLLEKDRQAALAEALFAASRHWPVSLHFNKGLAGAPPAELAAAKDTAMNPAVLDAFALAIIAGSGLPAFPGVPGHEPDVAAGRRDAATIHQAADELLKVVGRTGSYLSESNFFERDWKQSFWGSNYARLAAVKQQYDPDGLFFIHHGVGSDEWSADGFDRLQRR